MRDEYGREHSAIPEKYGRLAVKIASEKTQADSTKVALKPCNETLAESFINEKNREMVDELRCFDSQVAQTYGFSDYVDLGSSKRLQTSLQLCYNDYSDEADCESEEDTIYFFENSYIELNWYAT